MLCFVSMYLPESTSYHAVNMLSFILCIFFRAFLHPITGSNSQGFSKTESPLLYNFCFFRLPDVLGTRFMPAIY